MNRNTAPNDRPRKFWLVALFALLVFFWHPGASQNYISFPVGEDWHFPNARALGLAGAASLSSQGPGALLYNPAALLTGNQRLQAELSILARKLEERRGFPVFNRIEDVVENGVYAINNHWYGRLQGGLLYQGRGLALAVGRYLERDQEYLYEEEVRENIFGDALIAFNEIRQTGILARYAFGLAVAVTNKVQMGIQVGLLRGDLSRDSTIVFLHSLQPRAGGLQRRNLDNSPLLLTLGTRIQLHPRLTVGTHWQLPYTRRYQYRRELYCPNCPINLEVGSEEIQAPLSGTVALEYRARQALQARLNLEFTYQWWSGVEWKLNTDLHNWSRKPFQDVAIVRVGVEHIFYNRIPFQVGLQYRTSFLRRQITRTLISAGTGFYNNWWRIEVAGGLSRLDYRYPDLFPDTLFGGNRQNSPIDSVNETYFFGMATVRIFVQ